MTAFVMHAEDPAGSGIAACCGLPLGNLTPPLLSWPVVACAACANLDPEWASAITTIRGGQPMILRIFTRTTAKAVQPGFQIEQPKAMLVEEVHNTLTGLRIWGRRLGRDQKSPRVSIDATPETPIELPVNDRDSVTDLLLGAFDAKRKQDRDDEVEQPFEFDWLPEEQTFVLIHPSLPEPLLVSFNWPAPKGDAVPVTKAAKARAATKKAVTRTRPPATPPADAEPEVST